MHGTKRSKDADSTVNSPLKQPAQRYTLPEYPFVTPPELSEGKSHHHAVVIVGGGLTGLTLACRLAQLRIPAVLLDEDNTVGVKGASSRGICYTQQSLEIFQRIGIYERIAAKGIAWQVGRTFAGHDEVFSFDLRERSQFSFSQQPPFINIQQFYVEMYLVQRIQELNSLGAHIDLRWSSKVTSFEQNETQAVLGVSTPEGDYHITADHVIDASGSHTPFHAWVGASMDSKRGDDRWCIADVRFKHTPPIERHTWIEAPFNDNRAVWQHLMGDDVWRIDYQMAPDADPSYVSREDVVRERLAKQFGEQVECELVWVGPYAYKSQCLHQLRYGRVFFLGDTAKVVSPFGARGGNTGIADADNLAWKLAAVLHRKAPTPLLHSYNQERLQAAQRNVQVTNRTARYLRAPDGMERLFRSATIGLAKRHIFARHLINTGRMAEANRYSATPVCQAEGGFMVPNIGLQFTPSKMGCLGDLLLWADSNLLLLVFGHCTTQEFKQLLAMGQTGRVRMVQVLGQGQAAQALEHVRDAAGLFQQACGDVNAKWALLRPDAYLVARGKALNGHLVQSVAKAYALA